MIEFEPNDENQEEDLQQEPTLQNSLEQKENLDETKVYYSNIIAAKDEEIAFLK